MTLQNRVLPTGEITNAPWRGTLMGNRGILHDETQTLKTARWTHPHWVTCVLSYKDWHRKVMTPNRYTELFFADEASALAAGHRPCALCRRADYNAFRAAWSTAHGERSLNADDKIRHSARVTRDRQHIRHEAPFESLPDGTFIWFENGTYLVWDAVLLHQENGRYTRTRPRPISGTAIVLTPVPTVATLKSGYRPMVHDTAGPLLERPKTL